MQKEEQILTTMLQLNIKSYLLLWVVFLKDFLSPLLSSISEQHYNLVAVGP